MLYLRFATALAVLALGTAATNYHPLSDEYIAQVNNKQSTWTAGKNFEVSEWSRVVKIAGGVITRKQETSLRQLVHDEDVEIPEQFDAREKWPECGTIGQIRDQSHCGSCWAFGAVEAMSDRICIHSEGKQVKYISAEDLLSCCGDFCGSGCEGGNPKAAWEFWNITGIVTGGLYDNFTQGCRAYSLPPCEHHHTIGSLQNCSDLDKFLTPECEKVCDQGTNLDYEKELTYGHEPYILRNNVTQIQLEILKNGPVETHFKVYEDFPLYKSGVYQSTSTKAIGRHAVKILGWGVENNVPYWLIANSWNADWGDNGYVRFIRGTDHCGIENSIIGALPVFK